MFNCFWLSVPVQLIAWKDSSLKCVYYVSSGTLNPTHSLTQCQNTHTCISFSFSSSEGGLLWIDVCGLMCVVC